MTTKSATQYKKAEELQIKSKPLNPCAVSKLQANNSSKLLCTYIHLNSLQITWQEELGLYTTAEKGETVQQDRVISHSCCFSLHHRQLSSDHSLLKKHLLRKCSCPGKRGKTQIGSARSDPCNHTDGCIRTENEPEVVRQLMGKCMEGERC